MGQWCVQKTPAFSTAERYETYVQHSDYKNWASLGFFLFFFFVFLRFFPSSFFSLHAHTQNKVCTTASPLAQQGCVTSVTLAQRHNTLKIAHRDAAGRWGGVRGSRAGRGPNGKKKGGSMTGTLASRCGLGDNAALINFLFSAITTGGSEAMTRWESQIKKKIGRVWGCQEELRAAPLLHNFAYWKVKKKKNNKAEKSRAVATVQKSLDGVSKNSKQMWW